MKNKKLILFFAGWGMDENPFKEYHPAGYDFKVIYDYSTLSLDEALLESYNETHVIAWSMGVWAASQLLQNKNYPITESIAINGTPFPVDDTRGIPLHIFQGTLDNLTENTLYKFRRRMCGSGDVLKCFLDKAPTRSIDSLRHELKAIGEMSLRLPPSNYTWDKVYIGSRDKIFPVENQLRAWEGANYTVTEEPHYSETLWKERINN